MPWQRERRYTRMRTPISFHPAAAAILAAAFVLTGWGGADAAPASRGVPSELVVQILSGDSRTVLGSQAIVVGDTGEKAGSSCASLASRVPDLPATDQSAFRKTWM